MESLVTASNKTSNREREPRKSRRPERTCVGCGSRDEAASMIRLVLSPEGEVAIDLAETQFGRGAHVHPSPDCFAKAPKGLSRSFRQPVTTSAAELARALSECAARRVRGLLASAARSKRAAIGGDAVASALDAGGVELLVVACDAAAAARLTSVQRAIAEGRAVAWGTRAELGMLMGKAEVSVIGIAQARLASAVKTAVMMSSNVASLFVAAEVR